MAATNSPAGIAVDAAGNLYVADTFNHVIRKISATGSVSTCAGQPGVPGASNSVASAARFNHPEGVAVDASGNVYVADTENYVVRKIAIDGTVSTLAGTVGTRGWNDGPNAEAQFNGPEGIAADAAGNLYVVDNIDYRIREYNAAGFPVAESGNYTIRRISPAGVVSTVAGLNRGSSDGTGSAARFNRPYGIAVGPQNRLYVSCSSTDTNTIRLGLPAGPPVITLQPQTQAVMAGASVQLSVGAGGVPEPTYQWHCNGAPIAGANGSMWTLAAARASDGGDYTVVVTNDVGTVTSNKATLSITAAPTPTPSSGGGGGGGAPSLWFLFVLAGLGALRIWRTAKA